MWQVLRGHLTEGLGRRGKMLDGRHSASSKRKGGWEAVNKRFLSTSRLKNPKNAQFVDWRERGNPELPKRIKQSSWEMMGAIS